MRKFLVAERNALDMSQAQVADELELSEVYVRKLEAGTRNPSITTMLKFEQLYRKPMQDLFPDIFLSKFDTERIKKTS